MCMIPYIRNNFTNSNFFFKLVYYSAVIAVVFLDCLQIYLPTLFASKLKYNERNMGVWNVECDDFFLTILIQDSMFIMVIS